MTVPTTGYAPVNGLQMYYELHGEGGHPARAAARIVHDDRSQLGRAAARARQRSPGHRRRDAAHGRTTDIPREPTVEALADDVAALLGYLGIGRADILGYSLGGAVGVQMAVRHPGKTRKLVVLSPPFRPEGWLPEVRSGIEAITGEMLDATPLGAAYRRLAPNPDGFVAMVERIKRVDLAPSGPSDAEIEAITTPVMLVLRDADGVRLQHAVEMFRLLGGGVFGDYAGVPPSWLAVVPGATHVGLMMQTDLLARLLVPFLDEPLPGMPATA